MPTVLVIGGGPAGSSFAARMAQLGTEVTLVERLAFPRPRLGESLTPGVRPLLAATGAWHLVSQAGFPAARDVRMIWDSDETLRVKSGSEGLLVDRGRFDQLLLSHAANQGVRVLQPAHVIAKRHDGSGWLVDVRHPGGREQIRVDLIADARGRATQAGKQRHSTGERTVAVFAYWQGADLPRHATVAAGNQGWFWAVPLPDGRVNAQAFLDIRSLKSRNTSLEEYYRQVIAQSPLAPLLAEAEMTGAVAAVEATPACVCDPVTTNYIGIGDAALTLDPISSSGVQRAVQTALSGAVVANTLLRRPSFSQHAITFYRDSIAAAASRHAAWAGNHYATAARSRSDPFWTSRARPVVEPHDEDAPVDLHQSVMLAPEALLADVPCLGAEFVDLRRDLLHPGLDGPVAYLAQQPLAALLDLREPASLAALAQAWSSRMPPGTALAIARWLRRRNILVPADQLGAAA